MRKGIEHGRFTKKKKKTLRQLLSGSSPQRALAVLRGVGGGGCGQQHPVSRWVGWGQRVSRCAWVGDLSGCGVKCLAERQ
jgi:hypothetical protein